MLASSAMDASPHEGRDRAAAADADDLSVIQALTGPERNICSSSADERACDTTDDAVALVEACRMLQFIQIARDALPAMRDLADHPGWEIVLHIFIAGREGRAITTADLCERIGIWRPLAVRYIEMLHERDLIRRDEDGAQKPDNWPLSLTPSTVTRLQALLCGFSRGFREGGEAGATN